MKALFEAEFPEGLEGNTFECELCGMDTPLSGKQETDAGALCFSCMLWFERYEDAAYGWELPEDFYD